MSKIYQDLLRPTNNLNKFKYNNNDIEIQLNDWTSYDINYKNDYEGVSKDKLNDIRMDNNGYLPKYHKKFNIMNYGFTKERNSVSVNIKNFTPHFFIKYPKSWTNKIYQSFKRKLKNNFKFYHNEEEPNEDIKIKNKIPFYNFTNNKVCRYIRFLFDSMSDYYKCLKYITDNRIEINKKEYDLSKLVHETKVTALLRFFHVMEVNPIGWIKLPANEYKVIRNDKKTTCQIECEIDFRKVKIVNKTEIGPFTTLSYDIECTSIDGTFPNSSRPGDKVIQIGSTINIFGSDKIYKYIVILKKCAYIDDETIVDYHDNEKGLILGWCKFVKN